LLQNFQHPEIVNYTESVFERYLKFSYKNVLVEFSGTDFKELKLTLTFPPEQQSLNEKASVFRTFFSSQVLLACLLACFVLFFS